LNGGKRLEYKQFQVVLLVTGQNGEKSKTESDNENGDTSKTRLHFGCVTVLDKFVTVLVCMSPL